MNNLVFNPTQLNGYNSWAQSTLQTSKNGEPIKVNGVEGARAFQMMPNSKVVLFDAVEPLFYMRETDANNNPLSFKTFKYDEVIEVEKTDARYVTIEEFNELKEELLNGKYIWNADTGAGTGSNRSASTEQCSANNGESRPEPVNATNTSKSSKSKSAI